MSTDTLSLWSMQSRKIGLGKNHPVEQALYKVGTSVIQSRMPNCQDPSNAHFTHLEDVYFTYRKIVWTHEVSGTSGSDDWRSPVAG